MKYSFMYVGATIFGQLFLGQLNLANYFIKVKLDLEGLKIYLAN